MIDKNDLCYKKKASKHTHTHTHTHTHNTRTQHTPQGQSYGAQGGQCCPSKVFTYTLLFR